MKINIRWGNMCVLLTLVLIGAKLAGASMSWYWVFTPILVGFAGLVVVAMLLIFYCVIQVLNGDDDQ